MISNTITIMRLTLVAALLALPLAAPAEETEEKLNADTISAELYKIEADIKDERFLLKNLDEYLVQLPGFTSWSKKCITESEANVAEITARLKEIGEPADNEPDDVRFTRTKLTTDQENASNTLASCKTLLVRSDTAIKNISEFRRDNLQRQSFAHGRDIVTVVTTVATGSNQWLDEFVARISSAQGMRALNASQQLMLFNLILLSLAIGLIIRRSLSRWQGESPGRWQKTRLDDGDIGKRVLAALAMTMRRYIVPLLVSGSIGVFMSVETYDFVPTPLITIIMDGLPLLILAFALTYFAFKALGDMGLRSDIDPQINHSLRKRFNILAIVWFSGYMLFQTILANSMSESVFFLARAVLGIILVLNVIWIIWLTKKIEGQGLNVTVRIITSLILVAAVVAELTGYRNLSSYILRGIVGTLVAYGLFQVLSLLMRTFLAEFEAGKSQWQQRIRRKAGIGMGDSIPGFIWVRFIATLTLWFGFIAALLAIWKVPESDVKRIGGYLTDGFTVGSIDIVPLRIFEAIVVLIILLTLNGWIQRRLDRNWLALTGLERGSRESIATVGNYIGIALAIIIALAVAGMDFSKLAIIAGALSVGIGFGLQNIVNNFVSGLILLFERPIKTGDWVVASGGVEGHVKKISIRSTQIESFDRADIIVPNSELIAGNLTNWVHKNRNGRIRIPVSVAYGSNTEQVRDLLTGIAGSHPDVITGHPDMHDPRALFLAFGDSSLDFELRFFVKDIQKRINLTSDMNFAIDKAFRENGIEIPFPQRDVHMRDSGPATTPPEKNNDSNPG